MVDKFEIKSSFQCFPKQTFSGRIKSANREYIFVEIIQKDVDKLKLYCQTQSFDIFFKVNRIPYQIQRKALEYIYEFDLHSKLIFNEKYNYAETITKSTQNTHEFR